MSDSSLSDERTCAAVEHLRQYAIDLRVAEARYLAEEDAFSLNSAEDLSKQATAIETVLASLSSLQGEREDAVAMRGLLERLADTHLAVADCDADMGSAAFAGDESGPTQAEREALAEDADDALNDVLAWTHRIDPEFQEIRLAARSSRGGVTNA